MDRRSTWFEIATRTLERKEEDMGLFDMFGGSFEKKVQEAVAEVAAMPIGVTGLRAEVQGKTVTLHGHAKDMEAKGRAMSELDRRVKADNIINRIDVEKAPPPAPAPEPVPDEVVEAEERIHEVVGGDTLSALAKKYYGNANMYMQIFEANRDILDDPNLIKVGQKLKIPVIE
jgi:LysM repeat protein